MENKRKSWIDIAKGILILLVCLVHVSGNAHDYVHTHLFDFVGKYAFLYVSWYLPAFFIITGFCSNFTIPFETFFVKNFKSLVVPNILIGVIFSSWLNDFFSPTGISYVNFLDFDYRTIFLFGGPWFLMALFIDKLLIYLLLKYVRCQNLWKFAILILLMLLGTVFYNRQILPNYFYFQHALISAPFLFLGTMLRNFQSIKYNKVYVVTFWVAILTGTLLFMKLLHIPYPYVAGNIGMFWGNFWLCIIIGVLGTLALFSVCIKVGHCRWLEFLGRHTLTIYLLQNCIMIQLIKVYLHCEVNCQF